MKKIFILGLLLAPIVANADPVGPSAVPSGGTAVVATASAPYQTAAPANGDSTTVVSASYVKGAYNDAIAAVNKINSDLSNLSDYISGDIETEISDKQDKLTVYGSTEINTNAHSSEDLGDLILQGVGRLDSNEPVSTYDTYLATAGGVLAAIKYSTVKAVTTWGDDTDTTNLPLTPYNQ